MQAEDFDLIIKSETESVSIQEVENNLNIKFKTRNKLNSQVKPNDLKVDLSYQREININKVNTIMKHFNPNAIGVVTLSMRENGDLFIIDGSHRVEALKRLGKGNSDINAIVFFDFSVKDEAELFLIMNENRTKPKKSDLHKANVNAGNNDSIAIEEMLKSHGLIIGNRPSNGVVRAIDTLYKVNSKIGINNLSKVVKILKDANGSNSTSFQAEYLTAVATIIVNYKLIDVERLTKSISQIGDPALAITKAKNYSHSSTPFAATISLCFLIIEKYNTKLRVNRLDSSMLLTLNARNYLEA
jgi:hypothetical protein